MLVNQEGKDQDQAVAICRAYWEEKDAIEASLKEDTHMDDTGFLLDISDGRRDARQYRKDVIRVGKFTVPHTKQELKVDAARLDRWVDAFQRMKDNGVNVPIYEGHNRDKPLGSILDMDTGGGRLFAFHQFSDDDAVKTAKRNRFVSVKVNPHYVDSEGNDYGEVVEHVAVTPEPVVTDQTDFEEVLLSRIEEPEDGETVELSTNEENMEWLKEELSLADDATEDQMRAAIKELKDRPEKPAELSREAVDMMAEAYESQFSTLVKEGKITPACAQDLKLSLIGEQEKRNEYCLSRARSGSDKSLAKSVLEALAKNGQPVDEGEKTGAQLPDGTVELSRDTDEKNDAKKAKEEADETKDWSLSLLPAELREDKDN